MSGINALVSKLERLAATEVKQRIAARVRDVVHSECVRGFVSQRDPYGETWAPRKKPKAEFALRFGFIDDGHKLLDKTGKMINSLTARAIGDRVVMTILGYAQYLQSGTGKMVARKIFPEPSRGLGTWTGPIYDAAVAAVRELMA